MVDGKQAFATLSQLRNIDGRRLVKFANLARYATLCRTEPPEFPASHRHQASVGQTQSRQATSGGSFIPAQNEEWRACIRFGLIVEM